MRTRLFVLALFQLLLVNSFCQDTTFFRKRGEKISDRSEANLIIIKTKEFNGNYVVTELDGKFKRFSEKIFTDEQEQNLIQETFFSAQNEKLLITNFVKGVKTNSICFGQGGQWISKYNYDGDQKIDIADNPAITDYDAIFEYIGHMPEFTGGEKKLLKYLTKKIKYPKEALNNGESGILYFSFVINKTGAAEDVKLVQGKGESLINEAIRVINEMPAWKPGTVNNKNVRVRYNLPIRFIIPQY